MTQLEALQKLTDEKDTALLNICLSMAGAKIVEKCYPFHPEKPVPPKYYNLQLEIAVYLYNKQGAEGQLVHSENGISRTYESAGVPDSMLKNVMPFVGVFGGDDDAVS